MGTGKFLDVPQNDTGVSWLYQSTALSKNWSIYNLSTYVTNSYYSTNIGGGHWYYTSSLFNNISTSQSFTYNTPLDIDVDVTDSIKSFYTGSIVNNGFILKLDNSIEFSSVPISLKYFSVDTHTVYPPCLEIKWDDSNFNTGSSNNTIISTTPIVVNLENNQYKYDSNSIQRFRLHTRPQYPTRQFSTSSLYSVNYYLPIASYYQIEDAKTNEIIIKFDDNYTKISADSKSSYFDIYMNGLQPERYYNISIKTIIDGSTLILKQGLQFKVVN
jgi:hypothetical protein